MDPPEKQDTDPIQRRISDLSPAKRKLLDKLLAVKASVAAGPKPRMRPLEPGTVPLSFAQQRVWFMDQWAPGTPVFNLHAAFRLPIAVDSSVLERCLNEIVRRHEMLRTTFVTVGEQPTQWIAPHLKLALPVVDLQHLSPRDRESEALRRVAEEQQRSFDLSAGPLLRSTLLRLDQQEYVFLLTIHHIACDGWSMQVFFQELTDLYQAFATGQPSPLPDLPIQYADYAIWQRQWLQKETLQQQLTYWKGQLSGVPTLQLPTDRKRPAIQTFAGAHHDFTLQRTLVDALKTLSRQEGATLFMTLLATFKVLLCRYTGQEDIVVGSYVAGRNRAELERLIGFFLNTLVLRTDLSGNPTFRELLKRVRKMALDAYVHQDLPFARLVEELQPDRDLSRNPLFQVVFQMLNIPGVSAPLPGQPKPLHQEVQRTTTIVDLTCALWEIPEGIAGDLEYNTDLFEPATMARLAAYYQALLERIVANPEAQIWQLPLLTETDSQLLVQWNKTERDYSQGSGLVDLFRKQAAAHPTNTAFHCEGQDLTYGELDSRSEELAAYLQHLGLGPDVVAGLCIRRGLAMVTALLAILKTGGVYLPLDPSYPRERLGYMSKDAGMRILVTEQNLEDVFDSDVWQVVYLDDKYTWGPDRAARLSRVNTHQKDLAYIIYTSGSTGQPKGVAVEHGQILNRLRWMWEVYPFEAHEVGCQKTALNFVDSVWELLGPLLAGIPTVIIPDWIVRDPKALVAELAKHRVSRIWFVPSFLTMILDQFPDLQRRLPDLKFWASSGEALSWDLFQRFQQTMPNATLLNCYGTSEVWDVTWFDPRRESIISGRLPIGKPIHNVKVHILGPHLQPVPPGGVGELYVGGEWLARHYVGLAELTSQKFVPNPFGTPGARLYRTGDLVRHLPDGNLEYIGRIDQQLKIRGFRIEPAEIEAVLRQHEAVQQAVVTERQDGSGNSQLVAFCVTARGSVSSGDLRRFLDARLPEFMVPSLVVFLERLPLLPNGKVDRTALPSTDKLRPDLEHSYVAPSTQDEVTLAEIYVSVLGLTQIGIHDNFFTHLGGHSLLAMQLVSRIRQRFRIELPLRTFFENPTVSQLARIVGQQQHPAEAAAIPRVSRDRYRVQIPAGGNTPSALNST